MVLPLGLELPKHVFLIRTDELHFDLLKLGDVATFERAQTLSILRHIRRSVRATPYFTVCLFESF